MVNFSYKKSKKMIEENHNEIQTAEHLWNIANFLSSVCPPASRFHMATLERSLNTSPELLKKKKKMYCRHCGSLWNSKNCKIRILPRMHRNKHIMKLQKMEGNEPWKLNKRQKQKLKKFEESRSKIVYNCFSCKKKTIFPGSKTCNIKSVESTPFSIQKLNKGDMNAGLFIPSPCSFKSNEKGNLEESQVHENTSVLEIPHQKSIKCENEIKPVKIHTPSSLRFLQETPSNSQKSTRKKKKTLLGQIVNEDQNSRKKISLSSFLISL